jgi:hypothetical protein
MAVGKLFVICLLAAIALAQDKVTLEFYGEAFCPYCQEFMRTGLNKTLEAEGIFSILVLNEPNPE